MGTELKSGKLIFDSAAALALIEQITMIVKRLKEDSDSGRSRVEDLTNRVSAEVLSMQQNTEQAVDEVKDGALKVQDAGRHLEQQVAQLGGNQGQPGQ